MGDSERLEAGRTGFVQLPCSPAGTIAKQRARRERTAFEALIYRVCSGLNCDPTIHMLTRSEWSIPPLEAADLYS